MRHLFKLTSLLVLTSMSCGRSDEVAPPDFGRGLTVSVAPLDLPGLTDATYDLAVYNGANQLVWRREGLTSQTYGDGKGDLTFVGPCDASQNMNRVELMIVSLSGPSGVLPASSWQNPTRSGPLVQSFECKPNQDVPVTFNVTILRQANQGFFDIAVTFEDIFCSAKLDCVSESGGPLILLHDPATQERGRTVVMGFACTTGQGSTTWLHLNDVNVTCADGQTWWFDPSQGPGNIGGKGPFFQAATYLGKEDLPSYDKCYWNMALGVREGLGARSCVLTGQGTASEGALVEGRTAADTAWPFVSWSVPLTNDQGIVSCGAQALNALGSSVQTDYTPLSGAAFSHSLECATTSITSPPRTLCGGSITGVDDAVAVVATAGGVSIAIGGQRSPIYTLGDGQDVEDCCLNPCCTTPDD